MENTQQNRVGRACMAGMAGRRLGALCVGRCHPGLDVCVRLPAPACPLSASCQFTPKPRVSADLDLPPPPHTLTLTTSSLYCIGFGLVWAGIYNPTLALLSALPRCNRWAAAVW